MKIILIGCEYSGTTTLAKAVFKWGEEEMGTEFGLFHDRWKLPHTSGHTPEDEASRLTDDERDQVLALSPKVKEMVQRHSLYYHVQPWAFWEDRAHEQGFYHDYLAVGLHIEDTIYGRLYFDYGQEGRPGDRSVVGPNIERAILEWAPDLVLVLVRAAPDVIRRRMRESPHEHGVLREKDVERVLALFKEAYARSLITNKFELDTSSATVGQTLAEFTEKMGPYLTETDRRRRDLAARR